MYIAGIDGGATKTECIIGDEKGNILSKGIGSASNYQVVGQEYAKEAIKISLESACSNAGIYLKDIDYAVLGLAGADMEEDFKILQNICKEILGDIPFEIKNDTWIALRAGSNKYWGVVTICGTGSSAAGRTKDGKEVILRNLSYEYGNIDGGYEIALTALHYAFRSEELTFNKTKLEEEIPKIFKVNNIDDLVSLLRNFKYDRKQFNLIPPVVFKLASEGDYVCQKILIDMGHNLGMIASGVLKKLGICNLDVPIVLGGSVFLKGTNPILIDEFKTTVHSVAPKAIISKITVDPAIGAYYLALDKLNINVY